MATVSEGATSENEWRASAAYRNARLLDRRALMRNAQRLVVIAPHPDDEILSAGGLMALCARQAIPTRVIAVTDGEHSHRDSAELTAERLKRIRPRETMTALATIGCRRVPVDRWGIADGKVAASAAHLRQRLKRELMPTDFVVVPFRRDGHPDHEAVADAALAVRRDLRFALAEAPIWMWHWTNPASSNAP